MAVRATIASSGQFWLSGLTRFQEDKMNRFKKEVSIPRFFPALINIGDFNPWTLCHVWAGERNGMETAL
jgi:hypothetical protein